jgi:hypothetical protein
MSVYVNNHFDQSRHWSIRTFIHPMHPKTAWIEFSVWAGGSTSVAMTQEQAQAAMDLLGRIDWENPNPNGKMQEHEIDRTGYGRETSQD